MIVTNQLKQLRTEQDITQEELAKELDVSRQTINAIETGKYNPSLELALEIAKFFNTEVEEVFSLEE
ncbi:MAG: putative transcriptional regulator [Candidatus Nanohaloarchaea archaeon]|jgi:putative transcriptional regulator